MSPAHIVPNQAVTPLDQKLYKHFPGKVVKKGLSRSMRASSTVPAFVLEFLFGKYCNNTGSEFENGLSTVKRLLNSNHLAPSQRQTELAKLRSNGEHIIIDHVCVELNLKKNCYIASLTSLGLTDIHIKDKYPETYCRLLSGGLWCIIKLSYHALHAKGELPIRIESLAPIQVPNIELDSYLHSRQDFSKDEWIDVLLRSIGIEPDVLTERQRWLFLLRMIPLCENNYNICELGQRSTGKSYVYKEISPYSILISGGQTTVANLFYNLSTKAVGLVSLWDCVAFDEIAGIQMKDKDGIQIMKDYMASGSFSRGKGFISGQASMAFIGNLDGTPSDDEMLFSRFPSSMSNDTAFLDRFHAYLPGWEIPKLYPRHFTEHMGLVTDYFAEILKALRSINYADLVERYYKLDGNVNERDRIAIYKTVNGLIKLVYPDGMVVKNDIKEILDIALEMRQRVKYQLFRIGGNEFKDYDLSYSSL